jgi:cytidylate kinase
VRKPVITMDGPAGAGKSTVARETARRLELRFLDTGAMYRAFTWKALQGGGDLSNPATLVAMIRASTIEMRDEQVVLDGRDITREIRDEEVTRNSRHVADPPEVRAELVRLQQEFGREGGLVTEGRDQGTVVFPDAEYKFYLDASIEVRAWRRYTQVGGDMQQIKREIAERDDRDRKRPVGALRVPAKAIMIDTSEMTVPQVCERILKWVAGTVAADLDLERVAGYWAHLKRAQFESGAGRSIIELLAQPPWESKDAHVRSIWEALTHPVNLRALELWGRRDLDAVAKESAAKALEECRAKARV